MVPSLPRSLGRPKTPRPPRRGKFHKMGRMAGGGGQWALAVTPSNSSVRKGVSGRPTPENMLQRGLSAQA